MIHAFRCAHILGENVQCTHAGDVFGAHSQSASVLVVCEILSVWAVIAVNEWCCDIQRHYCVINWHVIVGRIYIYKSPMTAMKFYHWLARLGLGRYINHGRHIWAYARTYLSRPRLFAHSFYSTWNKIFPAKWPMFHHHYRFGTFFVVDWFEAENFTPVVCAHPLHRIWINNNWSNWLCLIGRGEMPCAWHL